MITINLDKKSNNFRPGEVIAGSVSWVDLPASTLRIDVRLIWYTVGKGSRDLEVVVNRSVAKPAAEGQQSFEFAAPARPNSFSGTLLSLLWAIEVISFPDQEAEQLEISITPAESEIVLTPIQDRSPKWSIFKLSSNR